MKKIRKIRRNRRISGQTIAEYVLIIAIVVIAAIGILGLFSDAVRQKIAGAASIFGGDQTEIDSTVNTTSQEIFTNLEQDGSID